LLPRVHAQHQYHVHEQQLHNPQYSARHQMSPAVSAPAAQTTSSVVQTSRTASVPNAETQCQFAKGLTSNAALASDTTVTSTGEPGSAATAEFAQSRTTSGFPSPPSHKTASTVTCTNRT
jgi:hypothetical protein